MSEEFEIISASSAELRGYLAALKMVEECCQDCFGNIGQGRPIDGVRVMIRIETGDVLAEMAERGAS